MKIWGQVLINALLTLGQLAGRQGAGALLVKSFSVPQTKNLGIELLFTLDRLGGIQGRTIHRHAWGRKEVSGRFRRIWRRTSTGKTWRFMT